MARFTIEIDTEALTDHTDKQLEEWVEFNIGARGGISMDNPLNIDDLAATVVEWDDSCYY